MKKLSFWASNNPVKARLFIAFAHILGAVNTIILGVMFYLWDVGTAFWPMFFLGNVFLLAYVLYPGRKDQNRWFRYSFVRQKVHDFTLVFSAIFTLALFINNFLALPQPTPSPVTGEAMMIVHHNTPEVKTKKNLKAEFRAKAKKVRKSMRAEFKQLKKDWKKARKDSREGWKKGLLIALTVLVALALAWVIAALSCSIACSGNEALALVVLVVGWGGLVYAGFLLIRRILRGPPAKTIGLD